MAQTKHGREHAVQMLELRRKGFANQTHIDNSRLVAGSPMCYYCLSNFETIKAATAYAASFGFVVVGVEQELI